MAITGLFHVRPNAQHVFAFRLVSRIARRTGARGPRPETMWSSSRSVRTTYISAQSRAVKSSGTQCTTVQISRAMPPCMRQMLLSQCQLPSSSTTALGYRAIAAELAAGAHNVCVALHACAGWRDPPLAGLRRRAGCRFASAWRCPPAPPQPASERAALHAG